MDYGLSGCMGYGMRLPANQLGGLRKVCGIRGYGLSGLWITREDSIVHSSRANQALPQNPHFLLLVSFSDT